MKQTIILRPHESRQAREGEVCVVRAATRVPPEATRAARYALMPPSGDGTHEEWWWASETSPMLSRADCPYGPVGTVLGVRETWRAVMYDYQSQIEYASGSPALDVPPASFDELVKLDKLALRFRGAKKERHSEAWRSPATMPSWAIRTHLRVESVRVCRVQGVTEDEAMLVGMVCGDETWHQGPNGAYRADKHGWYVGHVRHNAPTHAFRSTWDRTAKPGLEWGDDPWVWVGMMRRCEG